MAPNLLTTAISGISGLGVAVAISPLPIVAVCLLLTTPQGRSLSLLFTLGWATGLAMLGLVVLRVLALHQVRPTDRHAMARSVSRSSWEWYSWC